VLKSIEPQLGRYLMMKLDLNMKAPARSFEFVVAFRGDRLPRCAWRRSRGGI
jgi:hypothetical protein